MKTEKQGIEMHREKTIDQLLRETWMATAKYYNNVASEYGGSMTIGFTLLNIDPKEGTPSTQLPLKMGLEMTSLSRTLNKMEEKGLIRRERHPSDARSVLIKLTAKGVEMRNKARETVLELNRKIKERVGEDKLQCFEEVMNAILNIVNRNSYQTK